MKDKPVLLGTDNKNKTILMENCTSRREEGDTEVLSNEFHTFNSNNRCHKIYLLGCIWFRIQGYPQLLPILKGGKKVLISWLEFISFFLT